MGAKTWGINGELSHSANFKVREQNAHAGVVVEVAAHLCRELEGTTRDGVVGLERLVLAATRHEDYRNEEIGSLRHCAGVVVVSSDRRLYPWAWTFACLRLMRGSGAGEGEGFLSGGGEWRGDASPLRLWEPRYSGQMGA